MTTFSDSWPAGSATMHVEAAGATVGLGPRRGEPRAARRRRRSAESRPSRSTTQRRGARALGQLDARRRAAPRSRARRSSPVTQVGPVDVGQTEVVDVGVDRRHDEVAGEDRPVVPPLVRRRSGRRGWRGAAAGATSRAQPGSALQPSGVHRSTGSVSSRSCVVTPPVLASRNRPRTARTRRRRFQDFRPWLPWPAIRTLGS